MKLMCSLRGIIDTDRPARGIADIAEAGFSEIVLDFSMFCNPYILENMPENYGKNGTECGREMETARETGALHHHVRRMADQCVKEHLRVGMAAAPYLYRDTKRKDLNVLMRRLSKESIQACGRLGCGYVVVRPLFAGVAKADIWNVNREYYLSLADLAKKNGVMLLLENQCRDLNGHLVRGICADGMEAAEWVDRLNTEAGGECFGFCMDAGVCNLCGQNMGEFVRTLGSRIKAVILRDCDGNRETAMLPFTSVYHGQPRTNWLDLIRGLREISFDGRLVFDFSDTASAFSPLLRRPLIHLAKASADYFQWQVELERLLSKYPSRVLFGAGNICRSYMRCYGRKFPPLYTCDNNRALWGTQVCGLEVKPPECLKSLPETTAIFICNIYNREEIERQLRKMGLPNPVEFFNDDYMPIAREVFARTEGLQKPII